MTYSNSTNTYFQNMTGQRGNKQKQKQKKGEIRSCLKPSQFANTRYDKKIPICQKCSSTRNENYLLKFVCKKKNQN